LYQQYTHSCSSINDCLVDGPTERELLASERKFVQFGHLRCDPKNATVYPEVNQNLHLKTAGTDTSSKMISILKTGFNGLGMTARHMAWVVDVVRISHHMAGTPVPPLDSNWSRLISNEDDQAPIIIKIQCPNILCKRHLDPSMHSKSTECPYCSTRTRTDFLKPMEVYARIPLYNWIVVLLMDDEFSRFIHCPVEPPAVDSPINGLFN
jgi:hypothetical protein